MYNSNYRQIFPSELFSCKCCINKNVIWHKFSLELYAYERQKILFYVNGKLMIINIFPADPLCRILFAL